MFTFQLFEPNFNQPKADMNTQSLALLLQQTLDPAQRAEAEAELDKVSKIIGFAPGILQVHLSILHEVAILEGCSLAVLVCKSIYQVG